MSILDMILMLTFCQSTGHQKNKHKTRLEFWGRKTSVFNDITKMLRKNLQISASKKKHYILWNGTKLYISWKRVFWAFRKLKCYYTVFKTLHIRRQYVKEDENLRDKRRLCCMILQKCFKNSPKFSPLLPT